MYRKTSILLMVLCFVLVSCGQIDNVMHRSSATVENHSSVSSLSEQKEIDYYEEYLKPLETSYALYRNWKDANALIEGPSSTVGSLVQSLSGEEQWHNIWNKYYVHEDDKVYIPQEIAEGILTQYFNISADEIRKISPQYNQNKQVYEYDCLEDTGRMNLKLITTEGNGNTTILHYEDHTLGDDVTVMKRMLTIEKEKNGFKYISNVFDFKDDGTLDELTKEALTFEQDIQPVSSEELSDTENKVIICIKDKDGNPVPGLKIRFSGYTGYSVEGYNGQLRVTFPEIGFPPVYTKGKEFYTYTDANGEYEWDGSYYADKILPDKYWLHAGIEIEGEQYFKTSAVYYVDTKKDKGGGTYRYEYLWKHEEKPLLDTKSVTR